MKAEGTALMHAEMLEGEMTRLECLCCAAWVSITRDGMTKQDACRKHGISVEEYDANIEKALSN